jgi:hypothetical protein
MEIRFDSKAILIELIPKIKITILNTACRIINRVSYIKNGFKTLLDMEIIIGFGIS